MKHDNRRRDSVPHQVPRILYLRDLQAHLPRTMLSAFAVALGTALLAATGVFRSGVEAGWTAGANKFAFITEISGLVFGGVGLMMLGAAGFLIYNAFAMTIAQQQRQIGLLRVVGMTRGQVLALVLIQALMTGGLGTLLGVLSGPLVGQGLLKAMAAFGVEVGKGHVAGSSIALAIPMGVGISALSALVPARSAARVSPLTALRSESAMSAMPLEHPGPHSRRRDHPRKSSRAVLGLSTLSILWIFLIIAPPGKWTGYHQPWDYILSAILLGIWWGALVLATPALLQPAIAGIRALLRHAKLLRPGLGRLVGDNLARAPERVQLTALTFAVAVLMMVGNAGFVSFGNDVMVRRLAARLLQETIWYIYPFNRAEGLAQLQGFQADAPPLAPEIVAEVINLAEGRALVDPLYMVSAPEISSPFPGFPSLISLAPERLMLPGQYRFTEGDWDTTLPLLRAPGCAVLVSPAVAARHGAGVGDVIEVMGPLGKVACTVAATGAGGFAPMSILGPGAVEMFVPEGRMPDSLQVIPQPGSDILALGADLTALAARYGHDRVFVSLPEDELRSITSTSDQLMDVMNGLLFIAILAGALGSVNTTWVSIMERRHELALLRALGATRGQVRTIVVSESMITGLLGTLLGLLAGWGTIAIYTLTYGAVTFGLVDLPLWTAVREVTWPALRSGLPGLVAAPILAGMAAYVVARHETRCTGVV